MKTLEKSNVTPKSDAAPARTGESLITFHGDHEIQCRVIKQLRSRSDDSENLIRALLFDQSNEEMEPEGTIAEQLGLPSWLIHVIDCFLEPSEELPSGRFAVVELLERIPVGVTLPPELHDEFLIFWVTRMRDSVDGQVYPTIHNALNQVIALLRRALAGHEPAASEWKGALERSESARVACATSCDACRKIITRAVEASCWACCRDIKHAVGYSLLTIGRAPNAATDQLAVLQWLMDAMDAEAVEGLEGQRRTLEQA